jgi:acetate kinase
MLLASNEPAAVLAVTRFCTIAAKQLAVFTVALGDIDSIVFTVGSSTLVYWEHSA